MYAAQGERLRAYLDEIGADLALIEQIQTDKFWDAEPSLVRSSIESFFSELAVTVARRAGIALGSVAFDWSLVNQAAVQAAVARAVWFADTMTATSREQSAEIIRAWIAEPTTFDALLDALQPVYAGPRPDVAAATEVTAIYTDGQLAAWDASGVVTGYNVVTANDDRVRPKHDEVARNGPYALDDLEHRPPLDPNCRCDVSPVVEDVPNE